MIPKIAILLTCYNRKEKTLSCLNNLFKQEGINVNFETDVFLTDDASTDDTSNAVKKLYPETNIIQGNGHLYWNKGMHLAWTVAMRKQNYDYYLWLNDDTEIIPGAIVEMLACENQFENDCLVCGAVRSIRTQQFTYGGRLKNGEKIIPNGFIQECVIINGNCVLVSKKIVDRIGILDPIFPHAIGDIDYGLRALSSGFKVVTPKKYVGFCEANKIGPRWFYGTTPILERFRILYSPLGISHPYYYFIFEKRHFGLFTSIKHFFSIHLRAFMPSLWYKRMKIQDTQKIL